MSSAPNRLAILGCGYVANMYRLTLPLHPELELVGVYDLDGQRAEGMAAMTGAERYASLDALINDGRTGLVLNLTSPEAHFETTRACLEAGKHVFSEKPLTTDFDEARQLAELAEAEGLHLVSAPCTLLNEAAQTLWKAVRDRRVGDIKLVYAEMDDGMLHRMPYKKWVNEAGVPWPYENEFITGCTLEHAGYVLSWLAAFFGPAKTVTAAATTLVPDKAPGEDICSAADFSVAMVEFEQGVTARLTCGVYAPHDHRLRLFGEDGVLSLDDPRDDASPVKIQKMLTIRRKLLLTPWRRTIKPVAKHKKAKYRGSQNRDFCSGIAELVEAIGAGRTPRLSTRFGLHVTEMTLAIQAAAGGPCRYPMTTTFDPIEPMPYAMN